MVRVLSECVVFSRAYEYHSHAEYSAVINSESVRRPECDVLEVEISEDSSM
jgi:hypothetical protein